MTLAILNDSDKQLAFTIIALSNDNPTGWTGRMTDLFAELNARASSSRYSLFEWPTNAISLGVRLKCLEPDLRRGGIVLRKRHSGKRWIEISKVVAWEPKKSSEDGRWPKGAKFHRNQYVSKLSGSEWSGYIVGYYSTRLTPIGYAVESYIHKGSVQIYPEKALCEGRRP